MSTEKIESTLNLSKGALTGLTLVQVLLVSFAALMLYFIFGGFFLFFFMIIFTASIIVPYWFDQSTPAKALVVNLLKDTDK